jgi:phosphoesterase RecJ-like protein
MEKKADTPGAILKALEDGEHFIVTAHLRPDGDALGSTLGLHRCLLDAGKTSSIVDLTPIPDRYQFLLAEDEVKTADQIDASTVDAIIVLDSGAIDRAPSFVAEWQHKTTVINIDHHKSNTRFGTLNLIDEQASSVGEMLCTLLASSSFAIKQPAAEALWAAIVTDTGRFSYSNTSPATMRAAALLLETGIDTALINHRVYNAQPLRQLQLQARALNHLSSHEDGRVAMVSLSREDYLELGCTAADAEDIVNLPRNVQGVGIAVFLYEFLDEPGTKVSLRTAEPYDAAAFCQLFDGGGHARAAGCSLTTDLKEATGIILERIHTYWFSK